MEHVPSDTRPHQRLRIYRVAGEHPRTSFAVQVSCADDTRRLCAGALEHAVEHVQCEWHAEQCARHVPHPEPSGGHSRAFLCK